MNNTNENEETRVSIPSIPGTQAGNEEGSAPSRGASMVNTIAQEFQQFMWTHGISTMNNAKRQRLFKRLASGCIEVPARENDVGNASNVSPIENDDQIFEIFKQI